jgi:hypothetical protein
MGGPWSRRGGSFGSVVLLIALALAVLRPWERGGE